MRLMIAAIFCLGACLPAGAADTVNPIDIEEWTVPYESSRPRDPDAVSADEVWFVGQRGDYLANLDPGTGEFFRRDLERNAGPHNLIVGGDGIVWYAGNLQGYVGRYDPAADTIEKIVMPDDDASDPHTLVFDAGERHIWFTVQGGNFVGRLRVADRSVDLIPVPTRNARPYGIVVAPDGTPWIALFGTAKLASIDPDTLSLTEHALPDSDARPRRVGLTSDGQVYYVDYARGTLGRLDPASGEVREWAMPSGGRSRPYGMAVDGGDRIWFVESGASPNNFVGFDPATERFFSITPIPSGGGSVRHMDYHAATETIWFGTDRNTIGRAQVGG